MSCPITNTLRSAAPFFDDEGKKAAAPYLSAARLECWGLGGCTVSPNALKLDAQALILSAGKTALSLGSSICRRAGEYLLIIDESGDSFCFNYAPD